MKLEIKNLSRSFLGRKALQGVDLTLNSGECWLLLGPNGSGKSTMMKCIAGLVSPTGGEILLDGRPVGTWTKKHVAYMPTENFFYNYMTARDAGRYYRDFFRDFDERNYLRMIEKAGLGPKKSIRTMSSGESAKLRLALTLSRDAEIMMFDEPVNGVDMLTRDWVIAEINSRRGKGRALLLSTHLVEETEVITDHAAFLHNGKIDLAGASAELFEGRSMADLYREIYGEHAQEE